MPRMLPILLFAALPLSACAPATTTPAIGASAPAASPAPLPAAAPAHSPCASARIRSAAARPPAPTRRPAPATTAWALPPAAIT